ncbi:MAG: helix-turn-helix domain-containing protein [Micrococcales bacterium]|nr:helix-turn-helix domain-containing protein [Micrococcales bacterium]
MGPADRDTPRRTIGVSSGTTRVLDALSQVSDPPNATELATALGLHITTVRFHLDQLERAGLVVREVRHAPRRGRPSIHFRAVGLEAGAARDRMIEALADAVATGTEPLVTGHRWAERLPAPTGTARDAITETFSRLGFEPEAAGDTVRLRACPFREAARRHSQVVCQVHFGLAQGVAQRAPASHGAILRLEPFAEPDVCLLTIAEPA